MQDSVFQPVLNIENCKPNIVEGEMSMRINRYAFVFAALSVLSLFLTAVKAQGAVDYRFLEVLDADRKPVANARVETNVSGFGVLETDKKGAIKDFPLCRGDFNTRDINVSKSGYLTYEEKGFFAFYLEGKSTRYDVMLNGESPNQQYDRRAPIKIELLKIPTTSAERKTFEVKRLEQELLKAAKHGDAATVQSLLRTGVSANATDVYGIPAILRAVATGDADTIIALLAAGADVSSKNNPGRKALLYYLYFTDKDRIIESLARSLIKAGADVNARLHDGVTALSLANQNGDERIIKLIESAASKPR